MCCKTLQKDAVELQELHPRLEDHSNIDRNSSILFTLTQKLSQQDATGTKEE